MVVVKWIAGPLGGPVMKEKISVCRLSILVLIGAVVLTACVPLRPFRTKTIELPSGQAARDLVCAAEAPNTSDDRCAFERRTYQGPDGWTGEYLFASVEFDDQGWFWDRRQMEVLLRQLYEDEDQEYLIFAHAHGWQHNADACDNNVICLQRLLERMDISEKHFAEEGPRLAKKYDLPESYQQPRKPRKIVGVYISWRGKSGSIPRVRAATFWNRKRVGNRVGIGSVTELLMRLNDFRRYKNPRRETDRTQLVISGHSFGGQVIYRAIAPSLIERAGFMDEPQIRLQRVTDAIERGETSPEVLQKLLEEDLQKFQETSRDYGYSTANSIGDLVVLVNPAFEGSAYESLQFTATNRCYPGRQRPSMLVVTSTADSATRRVFPLGRALSNSLTDTRSDCKQDQRRAIFHTVGHLDRYKTHDLLFKDAARDMTEEETPEEARNPADEGCDCPYLKRTDQLDIENMRRLDTEFFDELIRIRKEVALKPDAILEPGYAEALTSMDEFVEARYGKDRSGNEMLLVRSGDDGDHPYAANYPYLVVSTNKDFIPSHSSIYGEHFTDFLRHFYFRHFGADVKFPRECFEATSNQCLDSAITPCERSWEGRLDYSCESP